MFFGISDGGARRKNPVYLENARLPIGRFSYNGMPGAAISGTGWRA
jgi:hypothetical protein